MDFDSAGEHDIAKPFLAHLDDLRTTIIRCTLTLFIAVGTCLPFTNQILDILQWPIVKMGKKPEDMLIVLEVLTPFLAALRVAFFSGLVIALPLLVFFIGQFIFPGLKANEKKVIKRASGFVIILFLAGVSLGYFITMPVALKMMIWWADYLGVEAKWTLNSYIAFTTQLLGAFGLVFQMPVVILILGRMGIVSPKGLREKRRHVIVSMLIVAMALTPPDVLTQLIMAVPMIILYEICIVLLVGLAKREQALDTEPGRSKSETPEPSDASSSSKKDVPDPD